MRVCVCTFLCPHCGGLHTDWPPLPPPPRTKQQHDRNHATTAATTTTTAATTTTTTKTGTPGVSPVVRTLDYDLNFRGFTASSTLNHSSRYPLNTVGHLANFGGEGSYGEPGALFVLPSLLQRLLVLWLSFLNGAGAGAAGLRF